MSILLFVAGLGLLIVGAELLVRGAAHLAAHFSISPLVIGLTIVAFGTSSPELAVNIKSVFAGQSNIAVGNVVGSNIFNVLLILGLSAVIAPLTVTQRLVRLDVPLMILLSVVVLLFAMDGLLSRREGILFVCGLVAYVLFSIFEGRRNGSEVAREYEEAFGQRPDGRGQVLRDVVLIAGGLILLVVGSRWLVDGATDFARYFGVSELVVGLTIVAAGTSLPEVFTSLVAAFRGERDIAVGNVVGSNIFNILAVLGIASSTAPHGIEVSPAAIGFDIPVMIAVAIACLPVFFTGGIIDRAEGALFLAYYTAYTLFLVLAAAQHDALPLMSDAMLYFVLPLTAFTLVMVALREWRERRA
jgi:cation:H+ antiporter